MMMSMFSSFEVLCAEFSGEKVTFGKNTMESEKVEKVSSTEPMKKADDGKSSPPASSLKKPRQQPQPLRKMPRFAPELDGVHCFETIVPY
ncbi:hypothetical protein SLA2020_524730 [Shorea laevis]